MKNWEKKLQMQIGIIMSGFVMQTLLENKKGVNTHDAQPHAKKIVRMVSSLLRKEREKTIKEVESIYSKYSGGEITLQTSYNNARISYELAKLKKE